MNVGVIRSSLTFSRCIALLMTLLLTSLCGFSSVTAYGARKTIIFAGYEGGDVISDWTSNLFPQFQEQTGIGVEYLHIPYLETVEKLKVMVAADTPPDVALISANYQLGLAAQGLLVDLEELVQRIDPTFSFDDFFGPLLDVYRYNGRLYGLPVDLDIGLMWYNKNLFSQAGLDEPKNYTWTDYLAAARKITSGTGPDKIYANPVMNGPSRILPVIWQFGGRAISPDRKQVMINQPEAVEAIQFLADMIHVYGVIPTPALEREAGGNLFLRGKSGTYLGHGPWFAHYYLRDAGFDWDIAPWPTGKYKATIAWGSGLGILSTSKNQEEAWEFIKHFLIPEQQLDRAQKFAWYPPGKTAVLMPGFMDPNVLRMNAVQKRLVLEETAYGRAPTTIIDQDAFNKMLDQELSLLWNGEKSARAAADALYQKFQPLLDN
jgi:multiple sugar transport system substrate-binding protein